MIAFSFISMHLTTNLMTSEVDVDEELKLSESCDLT